jgi:hypothetical protein
VSEDRWQWLRPMRGLDRRSALWWLGGTTLALAIGMLPWPRLGEGWSRAFVALANGIVLGHAEFGAGGQAQLRLARPEQRGKGENVSTDAVLVLSVKGYQGNIELGMSSRRDGYLPLLVLIAVVVSAPLPWKRRSGNLAAGVPVIVGLSLVCLWLGIAAVFAGRVRGVYAPDSWSRATIVLAEQVLLLPPANRFVVPLCLGLLLSFWTLFHSWHRPDRSRPANSPPKVIGP